MIDATCPWRIAKELQRRGYLDATSAHELGQATTKDPEWLVWLRDNMPGPYILVTYDNVMPLEHAAILRDCETTLAVIDKNARQVTGLTEEQYWRDVIHRHAHTVRLQPSATVYTYRCSSRRTLVNAQ